MSIPSLF